QKAVAGMDGIDVGDLGGGDDAVALEIALGGWTRPDTDGLIGEGKIGHVPVFLGEDADRLDAHLLAGAQDPQSDFAAIGYEHAGEHQMKNPNIEKSKSRNKNRRSVAFIST